MFVDHAEVYVRGGDGGHGCVSFRRERFRPKGGPDGGNGGDGGSVYAVADEHVATLLDFTGKHHWTAQNGRPGEGAQRAGRAGDDVELRLPVGTLVYDRDSGVLLKDLARAGERACMAMGGRGGRGNRSFATPTHQTPRECEPGEPGQERWLRLELKLIADVGLVGLPNAGKSTLLSVVSKATPKIAPYPFTTLRPQLGIAELSGYRRLVIADIPGLVEGAHAGAGLGDAFLRHIERTRVIVHLLDIVPPEGEPSPAEAYRILRGELASYSQTLAAKPELVVANKMDLSGAQQAATALREALSADMLPISAATREGVDALLERLWTMVASVKSRQPDDNAQADAAFPPLHSKPAE